ncbi:MAG: nucleotidyltransferase [Firmicutes bacterium]|nr:nucleotidyltransferase [Bacillota bacterium]
MFEKLITLITAALEKHGIPYMIIGGQAVLFYGNPRLTKDIDITLGINIDKASILVNALKDANLRIIPEDFEEFVKRTFVLPAKDEATGIRADFIFSFTPYENLAISRAKDVFIGGRAVKFASVEDVIIHKIFAGRARDLEDARSILIKNPDYDQAYLRNWLIKFGETDEPEKFIEIFEEVLKGLPQ